MSTSSGLRYHHRQAWRAGRSAACHYFFDLSKDLLIWVMTFVDEDGSHPLKIAVGFYDTHGSALFKFVLINIRKVDLLSPQDIEKHIEKNIVKKLGFNIKGIPRTTGRTADYECGYLGIEVTSFLAKEFV